LKKKLYYKGFYIWVWVTLEAVCVSVEKSGVYI